MKHQRAAVPVHCCAAIERELTLQPEDSCRGKVGERGSIANYHRRYRQLPDLHKGGHGVGCNASTCVSSCISVTLSVCVAQCVGCARGGMQVMRRSAYTAW